MIESIIITNKHNADLFRKSRACPTHDVVADGFVKLCHGCSSKIAQHSRLRLHFLEAPLVECWKHDDFVNFRQCTLGRSEAGMVACLVMHKTNNQEISQIKTKTKIKLK